jgi:hypothetical protein
MDTEEPNDAYEDAVDLGDLGDTARAEELTSQLAGTEDVDWWTYHCSDTLGGEVDPGLQIDNANALRVCMYMDCDEGGNPLFSCPMGTVADEAPFGFVPGCCVEDGTSFDLAQYNCPDSADDSVSVWVKIDMAGVDECIDYTIGYNC